MKTKFINIAGINREKGFPVKRINPLNGRTEEFVLLREEKRDSQYYRMEGYWDLAARGRTYAREAYEAYRAYRASLPNYSLVLPLWEEVKPHMRQRWLEACLDTSLYREGDWYVTLKPGDWPVSRSIGTGEK